MLLSPPMRARLVALDPWLRAAARSNPEARRILIRHVREEVPLEDALDDLRYYLAGRGAPDLGWPEGDVAQVQTLRAMCRGMRA